MFIKILYHATKVFISPAQLFHQVAVEGWAVIPGKVFWLHSSEPGGAHKSISQIPEILQVY